MLTRRKKRRVSAIVLALLSVFVIFVAVTSAFGSTVSFGPILFGFLGFK